jgi:hypothetical protein
MMPEENFDLRKKKFNITKIWANYKVFIIMEWKFILGTLDLITNVLTISVDNKVAIYISENETVNPQI